MKKIMVSQWFSLCKSPLSWFSLILLAMLNSLHILFIFGMIKAEMLPFERYSDVLQIPYVIFYIIMPSNLKFGIPILMFFVSMSWGGEYTWGTIRWPLITGYSRSLVLSSKIIALTLTIAFAAVINIIIGIITAGLVNMWLGQQVDSNIFDIRMISWVLFILLITILTFWVYTTFIAALVTMSRSPLVALTLGLMLYFVGTLLSQVLVPGSSPIIDIFRPYCLFCNAMKLIETTEISLFPVFNVWPLLVLIVYGTFWFVVAHVIFRHQDIK